MKLLYSGKTKEVFAAYTPGHLLIRYRDTVLGENGVINPGANAVLCEIPGKGELTCAAAVRFFERCAAAGIPTHFIRQHDDHSIIVHAVQRFPLEFVVRNFAYGSYLRRHPETPSLQPLDELLELFLKDDAAGDPLISLPDAVAAGHIPADCVDAAVALTRQVSRMLLQYYAVVDFKVEFGLLDGRVVLIDEVSADSIRLRQGGDVLSYPDTLALLARS